MIGYFGEVAFEVSTEQAKTFNDLVINSSANFASHKILNGPELLEYTGKNARTCSFKMEINSMMGLDVGLELETLQNIFEAHEAKTFALGNKILGQFVIESMSVNYNLIGASGNIISASVNINLKEYVNE